MSTQRDIAQRMAEAANNFLSALETTQKQKTTLSFGDEQERKNWHYIPRNRSGLPFKEMNGTERKLAQALIATGVSQAGYDKVQTIMALEETLAAVKGLIDAGKRSLLSFVPIQPSIMKRSI